jgi:hypothetical protein
MNQTTRARAQLFSVVLTLTATPVAGQIQPRRIYTGGGQIGDPSLGLARSGSAATGSPTLGDQIGGFGGGASGAFQGAGNGRWSASGAGATGSLDLEWSNGGQSTWALEYDHDRNQLFVNGQRMLRGENERCN